MLQRNVTRPAIGSSQEHGGEHPFHTRQTGFQAGDTQGFLKGQTAGGSALIGMGSVRIVPFATHRKERGWRGAIGYGMARAR